MASETGPATDEAAEATERPTNSHDAPEGRRPRVMVVNDTQEILDLFQALLEEEGYEVSLHSYAIRDLDEVVRVNPDLIVLDFIFGGENVGWQLLQKLRMKRETAGIPVVVCTAATQLVRETEGFLKAKDVEVVLKPFDIDDLVNTVRRAMAAGQRSRAEESERATDPPGDGA